MEHEYEKPDFFWKEQGHQVGDLQTYLQQYWEFGTPSEEREKDSAALRERCVELAVMSCGDEKANAEDVVEMACVYYRFIKG